MGRQTGTVVGQTIEIWQDSEIPLRLIQVQLLGSAPETVEWFDITGEDTAPVNGDRVVVWEIAENYKIAIATKDLITAAVNAGERKFYSRNSAGSVQSYIYLKDDGSIEINAPAGLKITANTEITGTLTVSGIIKSLVDIIADYAATAISLLNHLHVANLNWTTQKPTMTPVAKPSPILVDDDLDMDGNDILNIKSTGADTDYSTHGHEQGDDSGTDTEVKTNGPS